MARKHPVGLVPTSTVIRRAITLAHINGDAPLTEDIQDQLFEDFIASLPGETTRLMTGREIFQHKKVFKHYLLGGEYEAS